MTDVEMKDVSKTNEEAKAVVEQVDPFFGMQIQLIYIDYDRVQEEHGVVREGSQRKGFQTSGIINQII
jgi:hypothetical protein